MPNIGKRKSRDYTKGSEYGGVEGLVQPDPHEPTAREQLIAIHQRTVLPEPSMPENPNDMRPEVQRASTDQYKGIADE